MTRAAPIPVPPDLTARYRGNNAGRAWLSSLQGILADRLEQWSLEPDLLPGTLPWNGHGGMVVPVRRADGTRAALKVAYPHDEAQVERHALALWEGHGAVELLEADGPTCSMLLERLDAGSSLNEVPLAQAAAIWGGVVRKLSVPPDARPQWSHLEHIAASAEQWSDELPADWDRLGRPFPRRLLETALEVCQTRGAVGRRAACDVLVHTDLHFLNILARPGRSRPDADEPRPAQRDHVRAPDAPVPTAVDGYAAIDPQPMVGDAEFAVAPLLWNRLRELPAANPGAGLRQRCIDFSAAAGLDPEAARQWAVLREVRNALWYAEKPGHGGDLARSLWVASTLAGETLPGLPPWDALPEPGQAAAAGQGRTGQHGVGG
jgi:streptomycin 6-kinase